jgi:hypothetical protein
MRSLAAICISLAALQVGACSAGSDIPVGYRSVESRTQAAEAAASGVIAAAAERTPSELEHYLPGDDFKGLRAELWASVPETLPADPLRYVTVQLDPDPEVADGVVAVVGPDDSDHRFEVVLVWNASARRSVWKRGDYVDVPGDWAVVSARRLGQ